MADGAPSRGEVPKVAEGAEDNHEHIPHPNFGIVAVGPPLQILHGYQGSLKSAGPLGRIYPLSATVSTPGNVSTVSTPGNAGQGYQVPSLISLIQQRLHVRGPGWGSLVSSPGRPRRVLRASYKSDLRNHQAIVQPRLCDCLMVVRLLDGYKDHS